LSCSAHLLVLSVLSLTSCFECVVTLVTDRIDSSFLCKGPSSTSVKLFFSVSAQPQLLEVGSFGDVGIFKPNSVTSCVLIWFFFFSFLLFLWLLYSYENWIELNYLPLSLHLSTKSQIDLCISTLDFFYNLVLLFWPLISSSWAINYIKKFYQKGYQKMEKERQVLILTSIFSQSRGTRN
jgi:hypothetical protein